MNSTDYRAALASLGLTIVSAAKFLGVDERTSRRWAAGEWDIPEPVAMFLLYLVAKKVKPDKVRKLLDRSMKKLAVDNNLEE